VTGSWRDGPLWTCARCGGRERNRHGDGPPKGWSIGLLCGDCRGGRRDGRSVAVSNAARVTAGVTDGHARSEPKRPAVDVVRDALAARPGLTRAGLVRATGLSPKTVDRALGAVGVTFSWRGGVKAWDLRSAAEASP
jgi:hypothetical protein